MFATPERAVVVWLPTRVRPCTPVIPRLCKSSTAARRRSAPDTGPPAPCCPAYADGPALTVISAPTRVALTRVAAAAIRTVRVVFFIVHSLGDHLADEAYEEALFRPNPAGIPNRGSARPCFVGR